MELEVLNYEMATFSKLLQMTMLDAQAFSKAVEKGYIRMTEDGHLAWMLGSSTLLAYFCGRMWCGDKGIFSRRKKSVLWLAGEKPFPAAALNRLFGCNSLKQTRQRRKNMVLPMNYELIDSLFSS